MQTSIKNHNLAFKFVPFLKRNKCVRPSQIFYKLMVAKNKWTHLHEVATPCQAIIHYTSTCTTEICQNKLWKDPVDGELGIPSNMITYTTLST